MAVLSAMMCLAQASAPAQLPAVTRLAPADYTIDFVFKNATGVRELRDRSVLLSDPSLGVIVAADGATPDARIVGRFAAVQVFALPADSTLLVGLDGSWKIFHKATPVLLDRRSEIVIGPDATVAGVDSLGRALAIFEGRTNDSAVATLIHRSSGIERRVARLYQSPERPAGHRPLFDQYELVRLTPDGWVAVLRAHPYRIDWESPSGKWVYGRAIPFTPIPMNRQEREAYLERRAHGRRPAPMSSIPDWPSAIPPWTAASIPLATTTGEIVVPRTPSLTLQQRYDFVDRTGTIVRRVELPIGTRILGFGANDVYTVQPTVAGSQRIDRHPWP